MWKLSCAGYAGSRSFSGDARLSVDGIKKIKCHFHGGRSVEFCTERYDNTSYIYYRRKHLKIGIVVLSEHEVACNHWACNFQGLFLSLKREILSPQNCRETKVRCRSHCSTMRHISAKIRVATRDEFRAGPGLPVRSDPRTGTGPEDRVLQTYSVLWTYIVLSMIVQRTCIVRSPSESAVSIRTYHLA